MFPLSPLTPAVATVALRRTPGRFTKFRTHSAEMRRFIHRPFLPSTATDPAVA